MKSVKKNFAATVESSFKKKLLNFFETGIQMDLPFSIWRMPNDSTLHCILQLNNKRTEIDSIENAPMGFMFSPFEKNLHHKSEFIKSDVLLDSDLNEILLNPGFKDGNNNFEKFMDAFAKNTNSESSKYADYLKKSPDANTSKNDFIALVDQCKQYIEDGYYQKIVPSRQTKFNTNKHFHPVTELFKLCEAYEEAFISLVYIPNCGLWIGATPELLIAVDEEKTFRTISLAGTQEIRPNFDLSQVSWTQKEIEEQAFVSRYIVNCFKKIRLRDFEEYGPKTAKAGNLIHLKTSFKVNMEEVNFPQLGSVMLDLLHPTSAVCGMPMLPAAKFLKENEGYDREYYSGYLGPVNYEDTTNLFVNLRCARIYKNALILFAGAGVTEDSNSLKEWDETEIKIQTLLNVIGN
jgi:isochorismate synthase